MGVQIQKRKQRFLPNLLAKSPGRRLRQSLVLDGREQRRKLLEDVANVAVESLRAFWKRWGYLLEDFVTSTELLQVRDQLRRVFLANDVECTNILSTWLDYDQRSSTGWVAPRWCITLEEHLIEPNLAHLHASLAFGVAEVWPKLRVCRNPQCITPYFVAVNPRARHCPGCREPGRRATKRDYWNRKRRTTSQIRRRK
jgi:hypothetical protein